LCRRRHLAQARVRENIDLVCLSMYPWIMNCNKAIKSLSAMAHSGRLALLRRLIQAGPDGVGAGELAKFAGLGATTSSAQLLVLTNADLISSRRTGRYVTYFANYDRIKALMTFLLEDCCGNHADICCGLDIQAKK